MRRASNVGSVLASFPCKVHPCVRKRPWGIRVELELSSMSPRGMRPSHDRIYCSLCTRWIISTFWTLKKWSDVPLWGGGVERKINTAEFNFVVWWPHLWQVVNLFVDTMRRDCPVGRKLKNAQRQLLLWWISSNYLAGHCWVDFFSCFNFILFSFVCPTIAEVFWILFKKKSFYPFSLSNHWFVCLFVSVFISASEINVLIHVFIHYFIMLIILFW